LNAQVANVFECPQANDAGRNKATWEADVLPLNYIGIAALAG
jgi:hypothetical protein